MSRSTYWVRYQVVEDTQGGYAFRVAKSASLIALAAQINELVDLGWKIVALGATAPRDLHSKELSVVGALTHGRLRLPEGDPPCGDAET